MALANKKIIIDDQELYTTKEGAEKLIEALKGGPLNIDDIQDPPRTFKIMERSQLANGGMIEKEVDFQTMVYEMLKNINGAVNTLMRLMKVQRVPKSLLDQFRGTPQ